MLVKTKFRISKLPGGPHFQVLLLLASSSSSQTLGKTSRVSFELIVGLAGIKAGIKTEDLAAANLDLDPALRLAICAERALKERSRWHGGLVGWDFF